MSEHVSVCTMYGSGLTHPRRQAVTESLENRVYYYISLMKVTLPQYLVYVGGKVFGEIICPIVDTFVPEYTKF